MAALKKETAQLVAAIKPVIANPKGKLSNNFSNYFLYLCLNRVRSFVRLSF